MEACPRASPAPVTQRRGPWGSKALSWEHRPPLSFHGETWMQQGCQGPLQELGPEPVQGQDPPLALTRHHEWALATDSQAHVVGVVPSPRHGPSGASSVASLTLTQNARPSPGSILPGNFSSFWTKSVLVV